MARSRNHVNAPHCLRCSISRPLVAVLMWALHSAGRRAEALDCYATTRRRLADELGIDPGAELRAVHTAVLRGDVVPPALWTPA